MDNIGKLRLIYLLRILFERTDEEHQLSTVQISNILEDEFHIDSHRTTISKDIQLLKELGFDIVKVESTQNRYFMASRRFEIPELKMLIDGVESSFFITQKKSDELAHKLASLASVHQGKKLLQNLNSFGGPKPDNDFIYYIVDAINNAIANKNKLAFQYFSFDASMNKKLKNNGQEYKFSPYSLVWSGGYYYVVGYCDKHSKICSFRVDRFYRTPHVLDEPYVLPPEDFRVSDFVTHVFRMYVSDVSEVELLCFNGVMKHIIDKFGDQIKPQSVDEEHFRVRVRVAVSPTFFGWIFGFGGKIKILEPASLREKYREMLIKSLSQL